MSLPQHIGDLIFPQPSGHFETLTVLPSSVVIVPWTNSLPHAPQVRPETDISQLLQEYCTIRYHEDTSL